MTDFTKTTLAMALEDLLRKKPLSELTVTEIAERAGVNRQTFYYHFRNIDDLIKWTVENDIRLFRDECENRKLDWKGRLLLLAEVMNRSRKVIVNFYNSVSSCSFRRYVNMMVCPMVDVLMNENRPSLSASEEERRAISIFFSNLFSGYFFSWLEEDGKQDGKLFLKLIDYIEASLDAIIATSDGGKS